MLQFLAGTSDHVLRDQSLEGWKRVSAPCPEAPLDPEKAEHSCPLLSSARRFLTPSCGFPLGSGPAEWPWVLGCLLGPLTVTSTGTLPARALSHCTPASQTAMISQIKFPSAEEFMRVSTGYKTDRRRRMDLGG